MLLSDLQQQEKELKGNCLILGNSILIQDAKYLPLVVEFLKVRGFIHLIDMPNINLLLNDIAQVLQQRQATDYIITEGQKNQILIEVASIYVEDIIENSSNYITAVVLLSCAFFKEKDRFIRQLDELIEKESMDLDIKDSVIWLWRICHGQANLESSYLRFNDKLPDIKLQRITIRDYCCQQLNKKFSDIEDSHRLCMMLNLLVFTEVEQVFSPFDQIEDKVMMALSETSISLNTKMLLTVENQISGIVILSRALAKAGILSPFDRRRIELLQQKLQSPLLSLYAQTLETHNSRQRNQLLLGLSNNDHNKVDELLRHGEDVDQYFNSTRTPLLTAITECDIEMVKIVLKYKPDFNKFNAINIYSPLYCAITKPSVEITELLLKAGAPIFSVCYWRPKDFVQNNFSSSEPLFPINVVMEEVVKSKNDERRDQYSAVLKLLIQYGAGIGLTIFDAHFKILENDMVFIGGNCPTSNQFRLLTTAEQFIANIAKDKYPFWKVVLQQALDSKLFFNRPDIVRELDAIVNYINQAASIPAQHSNASVSIDMSSPIMVGSNAKNQLLKRVRPIVRQKRNLFRPFFKALMNDEYSRALRIACTSTEPEVINLVNILLEYKDILLIDINEQAGQHNYAAIHYASKKGNKELYELLCQNGAEPTLLDSKGVPASAYLESHTSMKQA